ncbi:hypothetical protein PR048_018773 [Dryococelus australis]|uniref:Uncharacterized protein n=1 Tax=Dryococelus australis TaxID=614101 RepID=A0ABQ9HD55_9NEOP|nr:hypothetical protein PR048_018773 [Dryococelus australis]
MSVVTTGPAFSKPVRHFSANNWTCLQQYRPVVTTGPAVSKTTQWLQLDLPSGDVSSPLNQCQVTLHDACRKAGDYLKANAAAGEVINMGGVKAFKVRRGTREGKGKRKGGETEKEPMATGSSHSHSLGVQCIHTQVHYNCSGLPGSCLQLSIIALECLHCSSTKKAFGNSELLLAPPSFPLAFRHLADTDYLQMCIILSPFIQGIVVPWKHGEPWETTVAEWLACSPPTEANQVQSPSAGSLDFCMWESCRVMPLVSGFSRGSPVSLALAFRHHFTLISITLIGSQDLALFITCSASHCFPHREYILLHPAAAPDSAAPRHNRRPTLSSPLPGTMCLRPPDFPFWESRECRQLRDLLASHTSSRLVQFPSLVTTQECSGETAGTSTLHDASHELGKILVIPGLEYLSHRWNLSMFFFTTQLLLSLDIIGVVEGTPNCDVIVCYDKLLKRAVWGQLPPRFLVTWPSDSQTSRQRYCRGVRYGLCVHRWWVVRVFEAGGSEKHMDGSLLVDWCDKMGMTETVGDGFLLHCPPTGDDRFHHPKYIALLHFLPYFHFQHYTPHMHFLKLQLHMLNYPLIQRLKHAGSVLQLVHELDVPEVIELGTCGTVVDKEDNFSVGVPIFTSKPRSHLVNTAEGLHFVAAIHVAAQKDSEVLLAPLHILAHVSFHCKSVICREIIEHPLLVCIVHVVRLVAAERTFWSKGNHSLTNFGSTDALSQTIFWHDIPWRTLKRSSHPLEHFKSSIPNLRASLSVFLCTIGLLAGRFCYLTWVNHSSKASSKSPGVMRHKFLSCTLRPSVCTAFTISSPIFMIVKRIDFGMPCCCTISAFRSVNILLEIIVLIPLFVITIKKTVLYYNFNAVFLVDFVEIMFYFDACHPAVHHICALYWMTLPHLQVLRAFGQVKRGRQTHGYRVDSTCSTTIDT